MTCWQTTLAESRLEQKLHLYTLVRNGPTCKQRGEKIDMNYDKESVTNSGFNIDEFEVVDVRFLYHR